MKHTKSKTLNLMKIFKSWSKNGLQIEFDDRIFNLESANWHYKIAETFELMDSYNTIKLPYTNGDITFDTNTRNYEQDGILLYYKEKPMIIKPLYIQEER